MDEPRWLDEHEQRAWRGLQNLMHTLDARLYWLLQRESGLSGSDYAVLVNLSEAEGHMLRAFELGQSLQWEKSRLSHHLTRMERRGLIERAVCPSDGRGAYIALTAAGMSAIEGAAPQHAEAVRRYFVDVLTHQQLDAMIAISDSVLAALAADPAAENAVGCNGQSDSGFDGPFEAGCDARFDTDSDDQCDDEVDSPPGPSASAPAQR